jgi:chromosome partitioning protein
MIIAFLNEKGGVGKTSLCFNVGWYLAELGKKILFIDLDGQRANLSFFCNIKDREDMPCMKDVLMDGMDINETIIPVKENIDILPGNVELTEIDKTVKLTSIIEAIESINTYYDYIFVDVNPTPTRIHVLTMSVADYLVIPMLPDVATLEANKGIVETYSIVKESNINPRLKVLGIVFNKFNSRANLSQQVSDVTDQMALQLDTAVFNTKIRNNISLSENVGKHIGITEYDPKSNGAIDIVALTSEILAKAVR